MTQIRLSSVDASDAKEGVTVDMLGMPIFLD